MTANNFLTEYPSGMDYAYVHEKSAIYQQERDGALIEVEGSEEEEEWKGEDLEVAIFLIYYIMFKNFLVSSLFKFL